MSIVHLVNPIVGEKTLNSTFNNISANNLAITGAFNFDGVTFSTPSQISSSVNTVLSTATLPTNLLTRGDGGSKNIKTSGITVDDANNIIGVTSISTNLIVTPLNTDLIIDASGNGSVRFQSIVNGGCSFENINSSNSNWISTTMTVSNAPRCVIIGTYYDSGNLEYQPTIGGHVYPALSGWQPLWLQTGNSPLIVGPSASTTALINANKMYVNGNVETTGILRCNSLLINNVAVVTPSAVYSFANTTESYTIGPQTYVTFPVNALNSGSVTLTNSTTFTVGQTNNYKITVFFNNLTGVTDMRVFLYINNSASLNYVFAYGASQATFSEWVVALNTGDTIRIGIVSNTTTTVNNSNVGYCVRGIMIKS
jgi:hypothetical protein